MFATWFNPVHPRERGERHGLVNQLARVFGSSPRARGTEEVEGFRVPLRRFIPASAGNGQSWNNCCPGPAVHPRERGERYVTERTAEMAHGSSPRARGTELQRIHDKKRLRFIPASAGNGQTGGVTSPRLTVHPRERGERTVCSGLVRWHFGSSPRARGTGAVMQQADLYARFIPASAGNGC